MLMRLIKKEARVFIRENEITAQAAFAAGVEFFLITSKNDNLYLI